LLSDHNTTSFVFLQQKLWSEQAFN
jgi:hypothetical protein